jgi:cytoskeleton protein RodZ
MVRRNQQATEKLSRDNEPWLAIQPAADDSGFYYAGVGARLRREREQLGETVEETCQRLRIRQTHLRAIEEGRFDELPGRIYAIGFVRTYAEYLGLDGPVIIERFKQETAGEAAAPKLVFPTPAPESRLPKGWLILLSIALATTAYGGWFYWQDMQHEDVVRVTEVPPELAAPVRLPAPVVTKPPSASSAVDGGIGRSAYATPGPEGSLPSQQSEAVSVPAIEPNSTAEVTATPPMPAVSAVAPATTPDATPSPGVPVPTASATVAEPPSVAASPSVTPADTISPSPPVVVAATPPAAARAPVVDPDPSPTQSLLPPPAPPSAVAAVNDTGPAPRAFGGGSARIVIAALMDSWVQVRSTAGELLLTRILHAGDTYNVPDRADIVLMTGNAGGLKIVVDGESVPPIGEVGEIRRDVVLSVAALRQR